MWKTAHAVLNEALSDLRRSWYSVAVADVAYKILTFALLMPAITGLLYWLRAGTSNRVMADVDIALFFLTTPLGITTLIVSLSLIATITAVEAACLSAIGLGTAQGVNLNAHSALKFGAIQSPNVLRLTAHMVLRVLLGLVPFLLVGGLAYLLLLRDYDINYYLSERPPQFLIAVSIVVVAAIAFVALLLRTIARWALALPLVLFENVHPQRALGESAKRAAGSYSLILATLAVWALVAIALVSIGTWLVQMLGRSIAPQLADSLALLIVFIAVLAVFGVALGLAVGIINLALFSLLTTRLYLHIGGHSAGSPTSMAPYASVNRKLSTRATMVVAAVSMLTFIGIALFAFLANRDQEPVVIIAHRGASAIAPENTLAAFNLAAEQRTDFVELDVQESADGEVVVVHDSDLMKVGKNALKIWAGDAASLRAIDVGSFKDPRYATERVPTLAEALAACKNRCRVIVELKSYGHNQQLEERVAAIVEAAGMENECVYMSLDHDMVRRMKTLRPQWRVGLLVAKAVGDLTELKADFLAVEARMATRRFIRRAHRAGQEVYIWTVNDPAWMFVGLSRGVDGLITDKPDVARKVIKMREQMSEPQRFLTAQLIRFGASTEALAAEDALRP